MSDFFDKETSQMFLNLSVAMLRSLTYSMSATDMIVKGTNGGNPELEPYFSILKRDQSRLMRMAWNLSELGNIGLGIKQAGGRLVELCTLCSELADTVSHLTDEKGISVKCTCSVSHATVSAEYNDIETILLNMISNSLLRCGAGDEIMLTVSKTESDIVITVADTGSGISSQVMPTLFNDYSRAEDLSDPLRGAGLGVSVAESLAKFYGGSIVISPRERGTAATITLPVVPNNILGISRPIYNKSMRRVLIGLSDFLDSKFFMPPYV